MTLRQRRRHSACPTVGNLPLGSSAGQSVCDSVPLGSGRVELSGPVARTITSDSLLTFLPPGVYALTARPYLPSPQVGFGDSVPLRSLTVMAGGRYEEVFA